MTIRTTIPTTRLRPLALALSLVFAPALVHTAFAATCTVTNINDSGAGSLRACIASAISGDTIDMSGITGTIALTTTDTTSTYTPTNQFTMTDTSVNYPGNTLLVLNKNLILQGPTGGTLALDGGSTNNATGKRLIYVPSGVNVTIKNLTLQNGRAAGVQGTNGSGASAGLGGGILNEGALTLQTVTMSGNRAYGARYSFAGSSAGNGASMGGVADGGFGRGGVGAVGFDGGNGGFGGGGASGSNGDYIGQYNGFNGGGGGFGAGAGGGGTDASASGAWGNSGAPGYGGGYMSGGLGGSSAGFGGAIFARTGTLILKAVSFNSNFATRFANANSMGKGAGLFICAAAQGGADCSATIDEAASCGVTFGAAGLANTALTSQPDLFWTGATGGAHFTTAITDSCASAPTATTNAAGSVTATGAILNGSVNDNGASTAVTFDYGLTTGYGTNVAATTGATVNAGAGSTAVAKTLTGLACNTGYHFRVKGVNSVSTTNGSDQSFTTSACVPTATTMAASSITTSSAILNGNINDNGASTTVTFDYGLTAGYGTNVAATTGATVAANAGSTAVAVTMAGLSCNTTYYFRVNGVNSAGTTNGSGLNYTTPACPVYTVTYNGNTNTGGSAPVDAATYPSGATVTTLGNTGSLVKTSYAFAGWNTAANGSGASQAAASTFTMGAANVALFAQWTLSPINGVCGSTHGTTVAFTPSANLCSTGSASGVTSGSGAYGWTCAGSNGGTTATCSASGQNTGSGAGTATVATNGWGFAAQGNGPLQSAGFIPVSGHPKSPPDLPPGVSFPFGLYDFVLNAGTVGSSAVITITYPSAIPAGAVYWKYGPTPAGYNCAGVACAAPHWYQFPAVMVGNTATLTIVDGGVGDDDLAVNGTIVDQGGPGLGAAAGIPTLSEWARMLLAGMLAMFGMVAVRRKNR